MNVPSNDGAREDPLLPQYVHNMVTSVLLALRHSAQQQQQHDASTDSAADEARQVASSSHEPSRAPSSRGASGRPPFTGLQLTAVAQGASTRKLYSSPGKKKASSTANENNVCGVMGGL